MKYTVIRKHTEIYSLEVEAPSEAEALRMCEEEEIRPSNFWYENSGPYEYEVKKEYRYGMRLRGFSPGAQPNGVIRREDSDEFWDVIVYNKPLTDEEVRHYSLTRLEG